jgi:hypothetical protein
MLRSCCVTGGAYKTGCGATFIDPVAKRAGARAKCHAIGRSKARQGLGSRLLRLKARGPDESFKLVPSLTCDSPALKQG